MLWKLFTFSCQRGASYPDITSGLLTLFEGDWHDRVAYYLNVNITSVVILLCTSFITLSQPPLHLNTKKILTLRSSCLCSPHCELHSPMSLASRFPPRSHLLDATVKDVSKKNSSHLITTIYKTKGRLATSSLGLSHR